MLLALPGSEVNANKQVLVLERLQLPFVSAPPLDLRIDGPMRVALTGPNGCGKSTLLKTILGGWRRFPAIVIVRCRPPTSIKPCRSSTRACR